MNVQNPTKTKETKHDAFLRLMHRRLGRALEELRLVTQLSSPNYENTPEEAEEVIMHLDGAVRGIATAFEVSYVTRIGKHASQGATAAPALSPRARAGAALDGIGIAKVLDHLKAGDVEAAQTLLRNALLGKS